VARGPLRIGASHEHSLLNESLETFGQDLARDSEVAAELVEAGDSEVDVAEDQRRPPLPGDIEGASDRTGHVGE
jgi:hypothetical protein